MLRSLVALCAAALLATGVACGGGGGKANPTNTDSTAQPSPTSFVSTVSPASPESPAVPTATLEANASPVVNPLTDDVIDLAVQLQTMTREQATCVFNHEDILQEFLEATGFNRSSSNDEAKVKQAFEDVIRKHPVQIDSCFSGSGG